MCAVILKRAISRAGKESLFSSLSADVQKTTQQQLLSLLSSETEQAVRRSVAYCISGLGSTLLENGEWPELFPFLFSSIQSGAAPLKRSALLIISAMATYLGDNVMISYLSVLRDAFRFALTDSQPIEVRVAAIDAVTSLVVVLEDEDHVRGFQELTPAMIQTINQALEQNPDQARDGVESLVTVAESTPELFEKCLPAVFQSMLQIAASEALEDNVRQLSVEFLLTCAENGPRSAKKVPQFLEIIFPLAIKWVAQVEDEEDWGVTQEDDDEEITFHDVGMESLDRLALALGGKVIQPIATTLIAKALEDPSWEARQAGLLALSQIAEGCTKQFAVNLGGIVHMVLKHLGDSHRRVRWAAVHCIAQLCHDFSPDLQTTFHSAILPALLKMLSDPVPRIVAHTCNGLVNFMDEAEMDYCEPYMDEMITKLLLALQNSKHRFVNEEILAAFAATASTAEDKFGKYYDSIVPYLKQVLCNPVVNPEDRMLKAKAMECISLIGMSVGKERFANDVKEVMEMFHSIQQSHLSTDDPQAQYILQAWARIAKCLGEDFIPYLPHVMPMLLNQASLQTDITITDLKEDDDDAVDDEDVETLTLAIKGVGDKRIQIKTSELQDKGLACSVLETYLEDVPKGMTPFVEQISQIMVPLLKFPYLSEIRQSSSNCLPLMLKCLPPHINKADMLRHFVVHLLEAVKQEADVEVVSTLMENFHKCVSMCDKNAMPDDMVQNCAKITKQVFDESLRRRKDVTIQQKEVADDEDEMEKLEAENEGEEELLYQVVESVGALVKTHQSFLVHFMNSFYPLCAELLQDKYGDVEHRLALCVFDDFVEHGSQINSSAVLPYLQPILTALLKFSCVNDPDVVQAAAYGLGVCAQYGQHVFRQALPDAVDRLTAIVKNPNATSESNISATANAVCSLVKTTKFHSDHESGKAAEGQLIPLILSTLPVQGDEIEAKVVHEQVIDWVLAGNSVVLGANGSNMGAIVDLCNKLKDSDLINDATKPKIQTILSQAQK
eukprot:NODE_73_length_3445_cov_194.109705_g67_i0.p1 GENE.NODE_73_length_3445_cov_194.109705_g67_i0~~NODE_73_length_3445_cov_194.109705_g67_i0.p1  ORF type:complete len:1068 (-),score=282.68 NODE_73_length_3445_cov_194.109705_g67_i0:240-3272(-)